MGQPLEQALRYCLLALDLGRRTGCSPSELSDVYYVALLEHLGCSANAPEVAAWNGGDDIAFRATGIAFAHASTLEFGRHLARHVGDGLPLARRARLLAGGVAGAEGRFARSWRSSARPRPASPSASAWARASSGRCARCTSGGTAEGRPTARPARRSRARSGSWPWRTTPSSSRACAARARRSPPSGGGGAGPTIRRSATPCWRARPRWTAPSPTTRGCGSWRPSRRPVRLVAESELERVARAIADFADLKSPWIRRPFAQRWPQLAEEAGRQADSTPQTCARPAPAGLVHDLGRVAVANGIWDKPGPLTTAEWERVRLHPYLTERMLARCRPLARLGGPASSHHERLDGSGLPPLRSPPRPCSRGAHPGRGGRFRRHDAPPGRIGRRSDPAMRPRRRSRRTCRRRAARRGRASTCVLAAAGHGPCAVPGAAARPASPTGRSRCCA